MSVYALGILFSIVFVVAVVDLMRRRMLLEQYSLFWLGMGLVIFLLSLFPNVLNNVAAVLGIFYAPSLLFFVGFLFMLLTMLQLTVTLSRLTTRSVRLVQEVAILRAQLEHVQQGEWGGASDDATVKKS